MGRKEKIVLAALEEFVEHGFAGARIRNICVAAGANLASVNYYFGGKEELYKAVLEYSFGLPDPFDALKKDIAKKTPPETAIRRWITSLLKSTSGDSLLYRRRYRVIVREMISPSRIFPEVFIPALKPRFELLRGMVGRLTGMRSNDPSLTAATLLTLAQCLFFFNKPVLGHVTGDADFGASQAERIAGMIVESIKAQGKKRGKRKDGGA